MIEKVVLVHGPRSRILNDRMDGRVFDNIMVERLWRCLWKMITEPLTNDRLLLALDDYINPKTGKKIFGCAKVFDHAAKQNQSKYPFQTKKEKKMTIESAKAFLERMKNDEGFRKECSKKSSPEDRMKFVKESGFDFSTEEFEHVKSELGEDELEAIGGGGTSGEDDWRTPV